MKANKPVLLSCGCTATAKDGQTGELVCLWHTSKPVEAHEEPDLTNRKARCGQCGKTAPSDLKMPYFKYRADQDLDTYYCGCFGWN